MKTTNTNQNNATRPYRQVYRFASPAHARSFADRGHKAMAIVHGDDGRFWVATLATFNRLVKAGYEPARI
ncbi:MAG: hypothetical protein JJU36_11960 [Phycisphaeraceae bacterium]|nr:hypothetical protein [Phycisphaeraceae bacterium]